MDINRGRHQRGVAFFIFAAKLTLAIAAVRFLLGLLSADGSKSAEGLLTAAIATPILGLLAYAVGFATGKSIRPDTSAGDSQLSQIARTSNDPNTGVAIPASATLPVEPCDPNIVQAPPLPHRREVAAIAWIISISALFLLVVVLYPLKNSTLGPPTPPQLQQVPTPLVVAPAMPLPSPSNKPVRDPFPDTRDGPGMPMQPAYTSIESLRSVDAATQVLALHVTVSGPISYGCGPTTGTGCFLVESGGDSYVVTTMFDALLSETQLLNAAIDTRTCLAVTGRLAPEKLGMFYQFDRNESISLVECAVAPSQAVAHPP